MQCRDPTGGAITKFRRIEIHGPQRFFDGIVLVFVLHFCYVHYYVLLCIIMCCD